MKSKMMREALIELLFSAMDRVVIYINMYGLAVSSSLMALVFLGLLYILFHMGLRENMNHDQSGKVEGSLDSKELACSIKPRVLAMIAAWNDTANSPKKVNGDVNVHYKLWSSNVIRRGLDPIYTDAALFTEMTKVYLSEESITSLMAPYFHQELQNAKQNQPKTLPAHPVCMN